MLWITSSLGRGLFLLVELEQKLHKKFKVRNVIYYYFVAYCVSITLCSQDRCVIPALGYTWKNMPIDLIKLPLSLVNWRNYLIF